MYTGHADDAADLIGDFQFSHTRTRSRLSIYPQFIWPTPPTTIFRGIKRAKKSQGRRSVRKERVAMGDEDIFDHSDRKEDAHLPGGLTDDVFTFTIWKATAESGGQKAETGAGIKTSHEEKKKRHIVPHSQLGNK